MVGVKTMSDGVTCVRLTVRLLLKTEKMEWFDNSPSFFYYLVFFFTFLDVLTFPYMMATVEENPR